MCHVRIFPSKARRPHTGLAIERIHLQAGIIGHDPSVVMCRGGQRFEFGIVLERLAGLFHLGQIGTRREILHLKFLPENLPHLARFVRVARGQQQALL